MHTGGIESIPLAEANKQTTFHTTARSGMRRRLLATGPLYIATYRPIPRGVC